MYGGLINDAQSKVLEDIQFKCCQIILGKESASYTRNLTTLKLDRLDVRRRDLMIRFAVSCYTSTDHSWWFVRNPHYSANRRTELTRFVIPHMRRERQEKRPFLFLSRLLNELTDEQWEEYGFNVEL